MVVEILDRFLRMGWCGVEFWGVLVRGCGWGFGVCWRMDLTRVAIGLVMCGRIDVVRVTVDVEAWNEPARRCGWGDSWFDDERTHGCGEGFEGDVVGITVGVDFWMCRRIDVRCGYGMC